jgi:hypothetical protein
MRGGPLGKLDVVLPKLTNLQRLLSRVLPRLGWTWTLPLRALQIYDRPLTALLGYLYLCAAVVARHPAKVA